MASAHGMRGQRETGENGPHLPRGRQLKRHVAAAKGQRSKHLNGNAVDHSSPIHAEDSTRGSTVPPTKDPRDLFYHRWLRVASAQSRTLAGNPDRVSTSKEPVMTHSALTRTTAGRGRLFDSILETVGDTPAIRINNLRRATRRSM